MHFYGELPFFGKFYWQCHTKKCTISFRILATITENWARKCWSHMTPGEKLRRARQLLGLRAAHDVDDALGFTKGRTSIYERDRAKPSQEYLLKFQKKYGIPGTWVLDPADTPPPLAQWKQEHDDVEPAEDDESPAEGELLTLPMFGDVPAGEWDESDADPDWIEVEQDIYDSKRFFRRISGDSMAPKLRSGDIVLFHPTSTPRDNVIVLAQNGDGKKTVKVCRYTPEGWILQAVNPEHQTQKLEQWQLVAYLVVVKRTMLKGLQVRFKCDVGVQPDMLPDD